MKLNEKRLKMNEYENMMVLENDLNSAKRKASYTFVSVSSSIDEDIQSVSDLPDSDVFSCTTMKNSKSFQDENLWFTFKKWGIRWIYQTKKCMLSTYMLFIMIKDNFTLF